ncbi:MAG: hypothetical protein U1F09_12965 [Steroidobacteraceae bacterium]
MSAPAPKPYVTARAAAERLGVPIETVIADVERGMRGELDALTGGPVGGFYIVEAWELDGERIEMHRRRLGCS